MALRELILSDHSELTPPLTTGVEELAPMVEELALSLAEGVGPAA